MTKNFISQKYLIPLCFQNIYAEELIKNFGFKSLENINIVSTVCF